MATKPNTVKKQKNGNITRNGKPKLKSLSVAQIQKLIDQGTQKNATSKIGKKMARIPLSKSVHASLGQNWIDAHSYAWLESRGIVVSSEMQIFRSMLFENFKSTNISSQLYLDAEESWRKVLVTVKLPESTDFDVAYGYEMSFFQKVSKSAFLSRIMDNLILKVV
jgi:hypothetical protein